MAENQSLYVLDTFALVAHFEAEIGGEKVRDLLKRAEDGEVFLAAAWLKAEYPISYADAFAASLAQELGASLVTGDPEFKKIKQNLSLIWLDK